MNKPATPPTSTRLPTWGEIIAEAVQRMIDNADAPPPDRDFVRQALADSVNAMPGIAEVNAEVRREIEESRRSHGL